MYGDRLAAAKMIPHDSCPHPSCKGTRCTADHWCHSCPVNQESIQKHKAEIAAILDKAVRVRPSNGALVDRLLQVPCLRNCGICPHPHTSIPQFSWQGQHQQDIDDLRNRVLTLQPNLSITSVGSFCWLSEGDQHFAKCNTDRSCLFPTDHYLAVVGWALHFHPESDLNRSAPLRTTVQNSYLAEVRAVAESLACASFPLAIFCDCQSVVRQVNDYIAAGRRSVDPELAPDLWDIIYVALGTALPKEWISYVWMPGHLDAASKRTKRENS